MTIWLMGSSPCVQNLAAKLGKSHSIGASNTYTKALFSFDNSGLKIRISHTRLMILPSFQSNKSVMIIGSLPTLGVSPFVLRVRHHISENARSDSENQFDATLNAFSFLCHWLPWLLMAAVSLFRQESN